MMEERKSSNFIENEINTDIANEVYANHRVHTRFPPEPNGYLHIGHAKSICLNFGLGEKYHGTTNLRFDDTNPIKEEAEYVDSIQEDVRWLGFKWDGKVRFASDYFEEMYTYAQQLIREGKAYVDDLSSDEIREYRGDFTTPGKESPWRNRSVEENLRLFAEMREGKYGDGEKVLRAKIDMSHPNIIMRDPVMYRVLHAHHHRTGDTWCIYPLYDYAHPLSDAIENITHSICTLEFEDHRPLYNWFLESWPAKEHPRQIEFARLNVTTMITSKRKLRRLVESGIVSGWDDPRMPTISGIRRRGYTPTSLRDFCERIGVAKNDSTVDIGMLEFCVREDLKTKAPRLMTVLEPCKVVLTNYPEGQVEYLPVENNQDDPNAGMREVPFGRELYIEQADFMEEPVKKFFRLAPGREVRLKNAYIIRCDEVIKDEAGNIVELRCSYDPDSKSGTPGSQRKVKGVLHWVNVATAVPVEARMYDYLFSPEDTADDRAPEDKVNEQSLQVLKSWAEPAIRDYPAGARFQFIRQGYFVIDPDTTENHLVVNRIVGLRDTWAKIQAQKK